MNRKQFSALTGNQPETIELAKDDIIISGDGVFALAADSLLDPRLPNVDRNLEISQGKINYILTGYQGAKSADGWQTAAADFDLTKAYQENGKYQFLLSLPAAKIFASQSEGGSAGGRSDWIFSGIFDKIGSSEIINILYVKRI